MLRPDTSLLHFDLTRFMQRTLEELEYIHSVCRSIDMLDTRLALDCRGLCSGAFSSSDPLGWSHCMDWKDSSHVTHGTRNQRSAKYHFPGRVDRLTSEIGDF